MESTPSIGPVPAGTLLAMRQLLSSLAEHHRQLRCSYETYSYCMCAGDLEAAGTVVAATIDLLTVHGALERDLLYPAAREALPMSAVCDELVNDNAVIEALIDTVCEADPGSVAHAVRFERLCLRAMKHGRDEEARLIPRLLEASQPWQRLAEGVRLRCVQLLAGTMAPSLPGARRTPMLCRSTPPRG